MVDRSAGATYFLSKTQRVDCITNKHIALMWHKDIQTLYGQRYIYEVPQVQLNEGTSSLAKVSKDSQVQMVTPNQEITRHSRFHYHHFRFRGQY